MPAELAARSVGDHIEQTPIAWIIRGFLRTGVLYLHALKIGIESKLETRRVVSYGPKLFF